MKHGLKTYATQLLILRRYQQSGVSVQHLSKRQQLAADALRSAAQTGLLDVVLVRISQQKQDIINGANDQRELYHWQPTTIDGWQTLSGIDISWASTAFKPKFDLLLQAWLISSIV